MQAANQCQTINIGSTVLSLAYDENSQTVYAGTGGDPGEFITIYTIDSNDNVSDFVDIFVTTTSSLIQVNALELVGNLLWVSYATSAVCGSYEEICTGGGILYCDITTGSFKFIIDNMPFWGIAYSPDQNMVYAEQVSFQSIGSTTGYIYWFDPSSPENYGVYVNLGAMGYGFIADNLVNPAFPPNAFQYGGGYLWIGTGTCKDNSCSSVFQCPAEGSPISLSSCTQLWRLDCNKETTGNGCLGAQSLIFIES
jgi:DNA-binding beta-propeller fold protein YncE